MKHLPAGCAWLLAVGAPLLFALSYVTRLQTAHGALDSLPFTGVVLTNGELCIGRVIRPNHPLIASVMTYGNCWKVVWARWDAARAKFDDDGVVIKHDRTGCLGIGLGYDDLLISSALNPPQTEIQMFDISFRSFRTPFWPLTLLTSIYPAVVCYWAICKRIRMNRGHCIPCGYDLTGNRSGICPECGTPISAASS